MTRPSARLTLLVALAAACGGGDAPSASRDLPPGLPDEGALLRLPAEGGSARLYRADSLLPLDWRVPGNIPPIARALGTDLDDEMVYAVDRSGEVVGIDLRVRQSRPYLSRAAHLSGSADGAVLGLDSARRPLRFAGRNLTVFRGTVVGGRDARLVPASGDRVVAYAPAAGTVQVFEEGGEVRRLEMPSGDLTTTWAGDLIAVTTDSGIALAYPSPARAEKVTFVAMRGSPVTSAFSPSGHRLYVARARGDIVVLDRFARERPRELGEIELPGPARALRTDRSGRWILVRPTQGDTVWLVDAVRREMVASVPSPWADDLPLVSGGRTLVVRDGGDVVAWDLTGATPEPKTRLNGAGGDVFLALPWRPREAAPAPSPPSQAELADAGDPTGPDSTPAAAEAAPATPAGGEIFIQVTSSQNRRYAEALADQLGEIGFRARVRDPETEGDGYRVLVGPYPTREEAEADGKRLGRPYFIRTTPATQP